MSRLVDLARQSAAYSLGNLALKASGILLAFVFTNPEFLSQADFGRLALIEVTAGFAVLIAAMGMPMGMIRFATRQDTGKETGIARTVLMLVSVSAVGAATAVWIAAPWIAGTMLGSGALVLPVRLMGVYIGFRTLGAVPLSVFRLREQPGRFVAASLSEMALLIVGVYFFVVDKGMGLEGILWGYVLSAGLVTVVLLGWLWLDTRGASVNRRLVKALLAFGLPLVAAALASRFLNLGDRYLIAAFMGNEPVAVYEWASRLGGVINMLFVGGFQTAFTVIGLKAVAREEAPGIHRSAFRHFTVWTGWAVLGLSLLAVDFSRLIVGDEAYLQIEPLVLLIGGGFLFYGLYFIAVNVLFAGGKSSVVAMTVGVTALLNVALNALLIPFLGLEGAAAATLFSYTALALGTAWQAQRKERTIRYPWHVVVLVVLLVGGLWGMGWVTTEMALVPRLAVRFGLIALYMPAVFLLGIYTKDDLLRAQGRIKGLLGNGRGESGREGLRGYEGKGVVRSDESRGTGTSNLIIGLGTGRCGTVSLARLLDAQPGTRVVHEGLMDGVRHPLPWNGAQEEVRDWLRTLEARSGGTERFGDVGYYFLPYVEFILSEYPDARFIALRREKEATVASYLSHTSGRNHWMEHDGSTWRHDPLSDPTYPTFDASSKREAIEMYWDMYYREVERLQAAYPGAVRLFEIKALGMAAGRTEILTFAGVPADVQRVGKVFHENRRPWWRRWFSG